MQKENLDFTEGEYSVCRRRIDDRPPITSSWHGIIDDRPPITSSLYGIIDDRPPITSSWNGIIDDRSPITRSLYGKKTARIISSGIFDHLDHSMGQIG